MRGRILSTAAVAANRGPDRSETASIAQAVLSARSKAWMRGNTSARERKPMPE